VGLDLTTGGDSGLFATPALHAGILYVNTHTGDLIAVDADSGDLLWSDRVGEHSWSSPAVVDGHLVVAACAGDVRSYSLDDPRQPVLEWSVDLGGSCLEATPAVWKGHIYIGSRDGYVRSIG
jgi:outer membrane protein assembly factor BamB